MTRTHDELLRRGVDAAVAATLLVLLAPVLALVALAVRLTSRGPILFVQERVGRDGVPFRLLKFRTMVAGAPARGPAVTATGDARITPLGRLLRRSKADELPQLVNVLRGDMSLVGPRPEVPCYVAGYTETQRQLLGVRPGITDPASLAFVDESGLLATFPDPERAYVETVLPRKLELSLAYLRRRSLRSDLGILVRTAARLFHVTSTQPPGRTG
jgi:lipopolysaccharide/colanic/teichoic acid biosynthesis glycosyltransferase